MYNRIKSRQEIIDEWNSMTFSKNFMFCKVMQEEPLCRHALEILLGIKIDHLEYPVQEMFFKDSAESHGIRLDVYTKDSNSHFDLEMQTTDSTDLLKRSRYYSSCIDVSELKPGMHYSELKKNYIIFLCLNDPFGRELPLYTYKTKCIQDDSLTDDETEKLFYNVGKWEDSDNSDVRNFFKFIKSNEPCDEFTRSLSGQVMIARQNAEYRRQYMTMEMYGTERFREGQKAGSQQTKIEDAANLLKLGVLTPEQISSAIGLPLEQVVELKNSLTS